MADPFALQLTGYNVDSLACRPSDEGGDVLVAGCSNFIGTLWTGKLALIRVSLLASVELPYGVPAVALLPQADPFTGALPLGPWPTA